MRNRQPWLFVLVLLAVSVAVVRAQLAYNQVIPPGQKRPDLLPPATTATTTSDRQSIAQQKQQQKQSDKKKKPSPSPSPSSTTNKKILPTFDRTQVQTRPQHYIPHDQQHGADIANHSPYTHDYDHADVDADADVSPATTPSSWRDTPRPRPHPSRPSSASAAPIKPPKAFAYLDDIGIAPTVPFISGMRPAGQTWNDAGLRPNVDPRLKSPFRKDEHRREPFTKGQSSHDRDRDRQQAFVGVHHAVANVDGSKAPASDADHRPKWELRPERPGPSQSDDAEAAATADEWQEDAAASQDHPQQSSSRTDPSVAASKASTAAAAAAAAGYDTSPSLVKMKNNILHSGKGIWKWIKSGGREKDGIALTMLQPKVHRPVLARIPMIPNDAKRDFVFLTIACIGGVAVLCCLWSSRVSPEDFQKAKRLKEYSATHPRSRSQTYDDAATASASSSRSLPGGRRRTNTTAMARRVDELGVASEDSDSEVARAILSRNNARRNRRISTSGIGDAHQQQQPSRLRSWFKFLPWQSRATATDGSIGLPLLSEFSRSSTPRNAYPGDLNEVDDDLATGFTAKKWSIPSLSRSASSTLLPSLAGSFTEMSSGSASGSTFLSKSPLRSITPQPQTQRQKERERSRERRRKAEQARWEAEQTRIRLGGSVAGPSFSRRGSEFDAAMGGSTRSSGDDEADDFEYFTRRAQSSRGDYDDVDIDAIESGLPSRAASANSFRSWRGGAMSSGSSSGAISSGLGSSTIAPLSSVKPLTPREQHSHAARLDNADSPYAKVAVSSPPPPRPPSSNASHAASSSLSSQSSSSAGKDFLAVPGDGDDGILATVSTTTVDAAGWDSGGSTPRATSLRRPGGRAAAAHEDTGDSDATATTQMARERSSSAAGKQRALP